MCRSRSCFQVASSSTQSAPSRSGMLAGCTMTTTRFPCVSTRMCRLRPVIFFPPIGAPLPTGFGRFHRLAVDDPGTGLRVSSCLAARSFTKGVVNPDEGAVERPLVKAVPDRVPVGEVRGKESPLTARSCQIEQGVDDLPEVDDCGPPHMPLPF